jgi:hypothetical protein
MMDVLFLGIGTVIAFKLSKLKEGNQRKEAFINKSFGVLY